MLKAILCNKSVSRVEIDQRARDDRLRLEQIERRLVSRAAVTVSWLRRVLYLFSFGRRSGGSRTSRIQGPLNNRQPRMLQIHQGWVPSAPSNRCRRGSAASAVGSQRCTRPAAARSSSASPQRCRCWLGPRRRGTPPVSAGGTGTASPHLWFGVGRSTLLPNRARPDRKPGIVSSRPAGVRITAEPTFADRSLAQSATRLVANAHGMVRHLECSASCSHPSWRATSRPNIRMTASATHSDNGTPPTVGMRLAG